MDDLFGNESGANDDSVDEGGTASGATATPVLASSRIPSAVVPPTSISGSSIAPSGAVPAVDQIDFEALLNSINAVPPQPSGSSSQMAGAANSGLEVPPLSDELVALLGTLPVLPSATTGASAGGTSASVPTDFGSFDFNSFGLPASQPQAGPSSAAGDFDIDGLDIEALLAKFEQGGAL